MTSSVSDAGAQGIPSAARAASTPPAGGMDAPVSATSSRSSAVACMAMDGDASTAFR